MAFCFRCFLDGANDDMIQGRILGGGAYLPCDDFAPLLKFSAPPLRTFAPPLIILLTK